MYNETHYYFNGEEFNKLVHDAGYFGIKDFIERSGIAISYKTIKRACNDSRCTRRTFYAIAVALAKEFDWKIDPIGTLKTAFEFGLNLHNEEGCRKDQHEENCDKKLENCIVYLSDGREALVQGKSIYWDWFDDDKTICFYDEEAYNGEDLRIAEFNKAWVIGIVRIIEELI